MARIVFDLDGTLIDSAPDIRRVANEILAQEGEEPISLAQTHRFIGEGTPTFVARLRAARGIPESAQDRLFAAFMERYRTAHESTEIYPGVPEALEALASAGHRLALCTNKPEGPTRTVMEALGLAHHFEAMICGDTLPVAKPDPAPVRAAFEALGPEGAMLYVGDSETDAMAADAAGVPMLLHLSGYRKGAVEDLVHAEAFEHWSEVPALVAARAG